jgi:hypothetical protein
MSANEKGPRDFPTALKEEAVGTFGSATASWDVLCMFLLSERQADQVHKNKSNKS